MHATSAIERINLRATPEAKRVIEQAARMMGTTVSAFLLGHGYEAALRIVGEQQALVLGNADRDSLLAALDHPSEPAPALRDLMKLAQ